MWQPAFHAIFFIVFSLQCGGYSLLVNRLREISMNGFDDTGKDKFKVVTPDKIASLFTSKSARTPLSTRRTVEVPITNISPTTGKTENAALMEASADSGIEVNDIINPYDNFSKELNAQRQRQVSRVLSMGTSASTINTLTRTVTAVTTDRATNRYRGHNPMNFGAYKRFKEAGQKDGRASVGGVGGVRGKKRKKGAMSADSFYDAIKKLGSGPVGKVRVNNW